MYPNISVNLQRQNKQEEYEHDWEPRFLLGSLPGFATDLLWGLCEVPSPVYFSSCLKGGIELSAGKQWGFPEHRSTEEFRSLTLTAKSIILAHLDPHTVQYVGDVRVGPWIC